MAAVGTPASSPAPAGPGTRAEAQAAPPAPAGGPQCAFTQEVRFAVVMYGGVSLAIYINGVSEELYHLVRATAPLATDGSPGGPPRVPDDQLKSTERVYRKLGQIVARGGSRTYPVEVGADKLPRVTVPPDAPIRTRFVVDILSGTSAGGINAIYLAKALATGQRFDLLKDLWIREGDIYRLINDRDSVEDIGLRLHEPPAALLSGRRMYYKLLEAFQKMAAAGGEAGGPDAPSPFAPELDLFVTTTDIRGLRLPLRLDRLVEERRFRNVFHFRYRTAARDGQVENDLRDANNPFLAFAARCTSSFPFAFEPMKLAGVREFLKDAQRLQPGESPASRWRAFFPTYRAADDAALETVNFGDGGYLDNKPFGYAIDALSLRHADVPLDRKLLYIDPSPEHVELDPAREGDVNAVENVVAALLTLPRYETIREDVQRVMQRNRLIERVRRIVDQVEKDVQAHYPDREARPKVQNAGEWSELGLEDMVAQKGVGYIAYHRTKLIAVTDHLTHIVARAARFDEDSDEFLATRYLVRAWREDRYVSHRRDLEAARRAAHPQPVDTENRFFADFDLGYRVRRIRFLIDRLDHLALARQPAREMLHATAVATLPEAGAALEAFRDELTAIRRELNGARVTLESAREQAVAALRGSPIFAGAAAAPAGGARAAGAPLFTRDPASGAIQELDEVLRQPTDEQCMTQARRLLSKIGERDARAFDGVAHQVRAAFVEAAIAASQRCTRALDPDAAPEPQRDARAVARRCARHYYLYYDDYDLVTFPVLWQTGAEELDDVEVVRVSPDDATSLVGQVPSAAKRKLAGTSLFNFGGFLESGWRKNDILWGRLDAAERLISILVPDAPPVGSGAAGNAPDPDDAPDRLALVRQALIDEAQAEIIADELLPREEQTLRDLLAPVLEEALRQVDSAAAGAAGARKTLAERLKQQLASPAQSAAFVASLETLFNREGLRSYLGSGSHKVPARPDPERLVRVMARSTRVVGQMLEALGGPQSQPGQIGRWVAQLGVVFWGLVEVAVPRSLPNLLFHYWLKLLYLFEALLLGASLALAKPELGQFALLALVVTLGVHQAAGALGDVMGGRGARWRRTARAVVLGLTLVVAVLGVVKLVELAGQAAQLVGRVTTPLAAVLPPVG